MPKGSQGNNSSTNNNHSNQCNPNNSTYQGHSSSYSGTATRSDLNNHSNQMNSNNYAYQSSRKSWSQYDSCKNNSFFLNFKIYWQIFLF